MRAYVSVMQRNQSLPSVEDVMTRNVVTITDTAPIADALEILSRQEIRHLPVVDDDGEVVGMLSDRDLRDIGVPLVVDEDRLTRLRARLATPVSELMSANVISLEPSDGLSDAVDRMLGERIGAIPVIDPDTNELVGIVSYVDLLRVLREALD